jgi:hypothetical protein
VLGGGLLVLAIVPTWALSLLTSWDKSGRPAVLETRHLLLVGVTGILLGALLANPLVVPPLFGSIGVLAIVLSGLGLLFAELQRLSEITVPPKGLTMLGFTRVPVFILLALWLAVASQLDDGSHHRIRTLEGAPTPTEVGRLWSVWKDANCVGTTSGPVPLVLIAAEGGGIRAAYWTASVLTDLFGGTRLADCPGQSARARVFAISSVSGGSLGAAAYLANPNGTGSWYEEALGEPDYVATPLATGLLVDLPRALLGFRAPTAPPGWSGHGSARTLVWTSRTSPPCPREPA